MNIELETAEKLGLMDLPPLRGELEAKGFTFMDDCGNGAAFLFPDGKYLCLARQKEFDDCTVKAHHMLDNYIYGNALIELDKYKKICEFNDIKDVPAFIRSLQTRIVEHTDGAITLNDGTNYDWENCYVDLPPLKDVTESQYSALLRWLDKLILNGRNTRLDISRGVRRSSIPLEKDMIAEDVIKEIKRFVAGKDY